jgi:uncharacterized protein YabN with tetrapyrrole methylase and pyrophosphatase domain
MPAKEGSLKVVGTGIQALSHLTIQAKANIAAADAVFYLANEPVTERYLQELNPHAESLHPLYASGKERMTSYEEMVERILEPVREGLSVCAAFYGHPGVFVYPSHVAIQRAREEGHLAEMTPGVSAEDCLFADLGVEPSAPGCQSFEATDFLIFGRKFDPTSSLVLWQVGVIGHFTFEGEGYDYGPGLEILAEHLLETYPPDHVVVVYEAAHLPTEEPRRDAIPLADLASTRVTAISTLYVPPREVGALDHEMLAKLNLSGEALATVERKLYADTNDARSGPAKVA